MEEEFNFTPQLNRKDRAAEEGVFTGSASPPSKETSPLRISVNAFPNGPASTSKDDFLYLNSKLSPNPNTFDGTMPRPEDLARFIPSNGDIESASRTTSPIKFPNNQYQSQGEFQFTANDNQASDDEDARSNFSFDDNSSVDFNASPTKQLNIQSDSSDLGLDNTVSSLVNTSIHTQLLMDNNLDSDKIDYDDPTPIVNQLEFNSEKTPIVPQTESLSNMKGKDIFDTGDSHLIEDLSSMSIDPPLNNDNAFNFSPTSNRIQSTTSSVYSEMPRVTSRKPTSFLLNPTTENHRFQNPHNASRQNVQSMTSSIYSELPAQHKRSTNNIKSLGIISESGFSPTKSRVSVRNQSLYQDYYNSETGQLKIKQEATSPTKENTYDRILPDELNSEDVFNEAGENEDEDDDASALFVTSLYDFSSETLESQNDSAICLSFDENEVAFTYKLDDSGWGEVTLLSTLKRGWVPMNYFRSTVAEDSKIQTKNLKPSELASSRAPAKLLLKHAGTFLLNPHCKPVSINGEIKGYTFDVESFNGMTDGIRKLLIDTDCISRSSTIVQKKPIVRKMRKKLLRGWAELVAKAKDYMGTVDTAKIEYLQLLTFQVLQKAVVFLDIWGLEKDMISSDTTMDTSRSVESQMETSFEKSPVKNEVDAHVDINYLEKPPFTNYRINEVYNQLLSYLALISGRIDLVEHNAKNFSILGVVVSQINLLVNEYLFIMKFIKAMSPEAMNSSKMKNQNQPSLSSQLSTLDFTSEKIKTLIDDLNSFVSSLHTISKRDEMPVRVNPRSQGTIKRKHRDPNTYFYSREGSAIVVSCCKMIELSSTCYRILKNLMVNMDDFQLPNNRKYPNYIRMAVSPAEFIKKGTVGLMKSKTVKRQVNEFKRLSTLNPKPKEDTTRASKRFSMFKTGNSNEIKISNDGLDFLSNVNTNDDDSPFISQNGQFDSNITNDLDYTPDDEIMKSADNKLIGISFKAIIYLLTDENHPPDYFLISTFFLTFRIFSSNSMLLEALVERFDINDDYKRGTKIDELHMRNRRKLIARTFQMWLESYWQPSSDYIMLAPLMNFFNEAMKNVLPVEGYKLLVVTSRLIGNPPIENHKDALNYSNTIDSEKQLLPRKISPKLQRKHASRMSVMVIGNGLANEIDTYNSFLEDIETYDLEKIDSNDGFDYRKSQSFNLNLQLKNSDNSSSLVTAKQLSIISTIVLSYRKMLGSHWVGTQGDSKKVDPFDTKTLIDSWWGTSQETWKIMNDDLSLLNFNGLEIAKQLTLIENKMFCSIKVGELLNQNFTTKKLHLNLSPNIQTSILFTNLLSDYVIESILRPEIEMKQRIHAFKSWLKIAISCLYLRNFNSLTSIITSLQSFLITRVTAIWDGISDKYRELFEYLTSIIHPNKNYNTYREKLRDFVSSNLQDNLDIPTVPYLSLFLQDLTFVVDGNPNHRTNPKSFLEQKLINIDKYFKITKIISDIQTLQVSYKDTGELGAFYNDRNVDIARSETIKNLQSHLNMTEEDLSFNDMFDIKGLPLLQELILLEIWKVKQTNDRDDDRSWKLSCALQPREAE